MRGALVSSNRLARRIQGIPVHVATDPETGALYEIIEQGPRFVDEASSLGGEDHAHETDAAQPEPFSHGAPVPLVHEEQFGVGFQRQRDRFGLPGVESYEQARASIHGAFVSRRSPPSPALISASTVGGMSTMP